MIWWASRSGDHLPERADRRATERDGRFAGARGVDGEGGATRTVRLALAYFYKPLGLVGVSKDFRDNTIDPRRLCLMGKAGPLERGLDQIEAGGRPGTMSSRHRLVWLGPDPVWLAGCKPNAGELFASCFEFTGPGGYPNWLTDTHCERLKGHVAQEGLVLIVSANSASEHDLCCRLLLRHSQGGLQTHDFSCRQDRRGSQYS